MIRALIRVPPFVRAGEVFEVRVLLQHPMESGFRPGPDGQVLPRDIVTRVEARLDGQPVFAADLFPAIAANPYLAFPLRVAASGTLELALRGDKALAQVERVAITVA